MDIVWETQFYVKTTVNPSFSRDGLFARFPIEFHTSMDRPQVSAPSAPPKSSRCTLSQVNHPPSSSPECHLPLYEYHWGFPDSTYTHSLVGIVNSGVIPRTLSWTNTRYKHIGPNHRSVLFRSTAIITGRLFTMLAGDFSCS